jgi:hypothetical protein
MNSKPCSRQAVHFAKAKIFLYQITQPVVHAELAQARVFFWNQEILHSAKFFQATIQGAEFLQVPLKSSFKKLVLISKLWQYAKNQCYP